jgi:hypothetical protein
MEVTISEDLLNAFVAVIAKHVPYAEAQPVFEHMAFELRDQKADEEPRIVTS